MTPPNDNVSPFIKTVRKDGETPTSRAETPAGEALRRRPHYFRCAPSE